MNTSPNRERQYFLQVRPDESSRVGWFSLKEPGPSETLLEVDPKWVWFGAVSPDATQLVALDEAFRTCLYSMQVPMTTRSKRCAAEGWVARGWLDDARVLVVRGGEIGVFDVDSLEVTSHGEADVRFMIEAGDDSLVLLGNEQVSWLNLVSGHKHVLFPVSNGFRVDGADLHRDAGRLIVGENRDSCEFWMAELRWEGR